MARGNSFNVSPERAAIALLFKKFYGASNWAARVTGVTRGTVSKWLKGRPVSRKLDARMPELAQLLEETKGACLREDVNGPSVRAKIGRIRRKPGSRGGK